MGSRLRAAAAATRRTSFVICALTPQAEALHVNQLQCFINRSNGCCCCGLITSESKMARMSGLEKMSFAELSELRSQVDA
jgi:hypothetical protein